MTSLAYNLNSWTDLLFNTAHFYSGQKNLISNVSLIGFGVGLIGLVWRAENLLMVAIFGELLLVSLVFGFALVSKCFGDPMGQVYALFILNAIAVESSIALVVLLNAFRSWGTISIKSLKCLRG